MSQLTTIACLAAFAASVHAAGNMLPNPSFETGKDAPTGWTLQGKGSWAKEGLTGAHAIAVTGMGTGNSYWRCALPKLDVGKTYRVAFHVKSAGGGGGGCVISGPSFCNRDYGATGRWTRKAFVFTPTMNTAGAYVRFGEWHRKDMILIDNVSLTKVAPVHVRRKGMVLGAGETVSGKAYTFAPKFTDEGSNYSRCLVGATAGFNSSRWVFSPGASVVYKQQTGSAVQTGAEVEVNIGYYTGGACLVECSRDGKRWLPVGKLAGLGSKTFPLPKSVFPAEAVFVRLRSPGQSEARKDSAPGSFQVHNYAYRAQLAEEQPELTGSTRFLDVTASSRDIEVAIDTLGSLLPGAGQSVRMTLRNRTGKAMPIEARLVAKHEETGELAESLASPVRATLPPNGEQQVAVPYTLRAAGDFVLSVRVASGNRVAYEAATPFTVPSLYDSSYGYWLGSHKDMEWWWCEGTYKISRERPAPAKGTSQPLRIAAARGEYEPVQIVLRPKRDVDNVTLDFKSLHPGWEDAAKPHWVYYHYVHRPTDRAGCIGWWPDALPPYKGAVSLKAGRNYPIWLLVRVPDDARSGDYHMRLRAEAPGMWGVTVPIVAHVYDFDMPKTPHIESAFGLSSGPIRRYHNLKTREQERQVWDLYMQSFRDHRISPYGFAPFDPIKVEFSGATWEGGEIVPEGAAEGKWCLKIVDQDKQRTVTCAANYNMPIDPGAAYRISWRAKTGKPGQRYLVTLTTHDSDGKWVWGHNIDLYRTGSGKWDRVSLVLVPTKQSPRARSLRLHLRATEWKESGEPTGVIWFDDVSFVKEGGGENLVKNGGFEVDATQIEAKVDFAAWDKQAAKYLDGYGFTTYRLGLRGMGGGTFHSRRYGQIGPFKQGSPGYRRVFRDYCQQLQHHLEAKGWLKKAYIYWFDEPAPKDYDFVREGMEEIKRAGPKLRRMLTEEPTEPLFGAVDLWCPVLHNYDAEACQARQKQGEQIWWYVCTGPKSPYPTLFIDHNAINLRIWLWMSWKWNVQGILVWTSNYWTSSCAFPPPKLQNPWADPMGYVAGYGRPPGSIAYWGNGDGRFLYPPNQDVANDKSVHLEGPVSSIRWEMLREGLEDFEYFWVLRDTISRARKAGVSEQILADVEKLLTIPQSIIEDKTHFTRDPQPLYARRAAVAEAIERVARAIPRPPTKGAAMKKQTIVVSLQAPDSAWRARIEEVHRVGDELWVLSKLSRPPGPGLAVISTVTDRVELTAPALPVRHFVYGKTWGWRSRAPYTFIRGRDEIADQLAAGEKVWPR